jgi:hypothetical protein
MFMAKGYIEGMTRLICIHSVIGRRIDQFILIILTFRPPGSIVFLGGDNERYIDESNVIHVSLRIETVEYREKIYAKPGVVESSIDIMTT